MQHYDYTDTHCEDCQIETSGKKDWQWYMVLNKVWAEATRTRPVYILCIPCLEARLGRPLTPDDFRDVLLNYMAATSNTSTKLLRARLGSRFLEVPKSWRVLAEP